MLGALLFPRSPAVFCTAFAKHNNLRILDQHAGIISPALDLPPTEGDPLSPAPWMKHEQSNDNTLGFIVYRSWCQSFYSASSLRPLSGQALPGRATRMNQWTFFNKKIGALKHQAADGNAPATLVKETTSGRNRGPKPKKAGSDDEPAAPIVASQEYQPQQVLTGKPVRGFTYMDMPQHSHPQFHEPIQMYPGPSHHHFLSMLTPILIPHIEVNSGPARARLIRNGEWARGQRKVSQAEEKGRRSGLNIESNAVSMSWRLHVALCMVQTIFPPTFLGAELTDALAVRGQAAAFNLLELAKQATFLCQDPGQLHCRSLARPLSKMRKWKVSSRMKKRRMELLKDDDMAVLAGHKVKLEVEDPDDERQ
ncbi:hypothetical protein FocTR4_00002090 [Fusarium oxysporum f. sp. cubense]|uniref:Uncharacterized protein n=1 Tax=Fusarium oxysporum f. sp. cubense TaxID=61366 RepID=A0A5C6T3K3_FUSOC|nr:hypothetical protein FocTR4_00002090 [Fusarium oxysporum f. sp. cubense]